MTLILSMTGGILLAAVIGLSINPTDYSKPADMRLRLHAITAVLTGISAVQLVLSMFIIEGNDKNRRHSVVPVDTRDTGEGKNPRAPPELADGVTDTTELLPKCTSPKPHFVYYAVGVCLSACMQFTGINCIVVYAPVIMSHFGLSALVGNLLVDAWNFAAALIAPFAAKYWQPRKMFLTGAATLSASCVFCCIVIFPGVLPASAGHVLGALCILAFIGAYEVGIGGPYYVLMPSLFSPATTKSWCKYCCGVGIRLCTGREPALPHQCRVFVRGAIGGSIAGRGWVLLGVRRRWMCDNPRPLQIHDSSSGRG